MTSHKKSGFHTFKNSTMSFGFDMFLFLLLKGDTQANPWIFSDSAQS
jgi:hypothetical protein